MRQAAASAITEALRLRGNYQIFFVVTLSAGRLRPEDLTTIYLVLWNAPDINEFSIIINKLSQKEYDGLQNNNEKSRLLAPLNLLGGHHKYTVLLLLHNPKLEDADDKIVNHPELVSFASNASCVNVDPTNVGEIPGDDDSFKEQLDSMTDKINNYQQPPQIVLYPDQPSAQVKLINFTKFIKSLSFLINFILLLREGLKKGKKIVLFLPSRLTHLQFCLKEMIYRKTRI